jgi:D-alanyl-D-alanine carboxypeptidase
MTSTIGDLGVWGASESGNALLPHDLVRQRENYGDVDGYKYGRGLIKFRDWIGHEGEALGWETIAVHNTKTDVTLGFASNSCGVSALWISLVAALYPESPLF